MIKTRFTFLTVRLYEWINDMINNVISSKVKKSYSILYYVVEPRNWSIKWDGKYITENLNKLGLIKARVTITHYGTKNQILHLGSVNTFLTPKGFRMMHKSNKVVLTWFHVVSDDPRIKFVKEAQKYVDVVHTSSRITRKKLIEIGIPEDKIVVIPLGVDLRLFKPVASEEKQKLRKKFGVPKDKIVIGSFQKDGVGWGEGLQPKWIKGPDILVRVVEELKKDYDIFVLLLGPARGYVKRELDKRSIPYKHVFLKNYLEIPTYYNTLDLYLVTSRGEGGPKAVLEAMAAGIPIVSTKVGMAPNVIKDGYNGLLAEVNDVQMLLENARKILDEKTFSKKIIENGLKVVKDYSWEEIAKRYHGKIYSPLME
ncbi:MAG: glycosyltransferase family 4 protein [Candidatus Heimdallarchaeota archaeon]